VKSLRKTVYYIVKTEEKEEEDEEKGGVGRRRGREGGIESIRSRNEVLGLRYELGEMNINIIINIECFCKNTRERGDS
jgi:hypothetical protein